MERRSFEITACLFLDLAKEWLALATDSLCAKSYNQTGGSSKSESEARRRLYINHALTVILQTRLLHSCYKYIYNPLPSWDAVVV